MASSLITENVQKHSTQKGHRALRNHQSSTMTEVWGTVEWSVR